MTVFITGPDGSFYGVDTWSAPVPVRPEGRTPWEVTDLERFLPPSQDYYVVESLAFDQRGVLFALVPTWRSARPARRSP